MLDVILANWDLPFFDSAKVTTAAGYVPYPVGKNSVETEGGAKKYFVAKLIYFYCDQDFYIRFGDAQSLAHFFYGNRPYTLMHNTKIVHYAYSTVAGTLEMKFAGDLPQNMRPPYE